MDLQHDVLGIGYRTKFKGLLEWISACIGYRTAKACMCGWVHVCLCVCTLVHACTCAWYLVRLYKVPGELP